MPDTDGRRRSLADFRGKVTILFFGYTSCPDICPTTLTHLVTVLKQLGESAAKVQVLFVTLDPERDTAEGLATYLHWFHPDFLGLRGTPAETREMTAAFRVFSTRSTVPGALGYVIDHSAGAYVYDQEGRLRLFVQDPGRIEALVADVRQLLGN